MGSWPSFCRFLSSKLPRFHCWLKVWRKLTPASTRRAMPTSVREGVATQLPLLNHPHAALFIFILRVTYMRASELLALGKKDLFSPLVPLLLCWSVVIAASDTGVSTKTGVRDGSVFMDQRWLQWANKLLATYQTCHSGASIGRVQGFKTLQKVQKRSVALLSPAPKTALWPSGKTELQVQRAHCTSANERLFCSGRFSLQ